MLEQLREGDTIVVWKLDRLARSTRNLLEISDVIAEAGAGLKSLSEPWADTTTPAGRMVLTVFAGLAEFEKELIRERTGTGRIAAMRRGDELLARESVRRLPLQPRAGRDVRGRERAPGDVKVFTRGEQVEDDVQTKQDGRDGEDHAHDPEGLADRVIKVQRR